MENTAIYIKADIGNHVEYKKEMYKILDVNEPEQLFKIQFPSGKQTWVRTENTTYIPF